MAEHISQVSFEGNEVRVLTREIASSKERYHTSIHPIHQDVITGRRPGGKLKEKGPMGSDVL